MNTQAFDAPWRIERNGHLSFRAVYEVVIAEGKAA